MFKWLEKRRVRNDLLSDMGYHKKMVRKFEKEILAQLDWGIVSIVDDLQSRAIYHQNRVDEIEFSLRNL